MHNIGILLIPLLAVTGVGFTESDDELFTMEHYEALALDMTYDEVVEIMERFKPAFRACLMDASNSGSAAGTGSLVASFRIGATGDVSGVRLAPSGAAPK